MLKVKNGNSIQEYCLLIRNSCGGGMHFTFSSVESLRKSLAVYFTESEQHIVQQLTTFHSNELVDGMATHSWRNFQVSAYHFDD